MNDDPSTSLIRTWLLWALTGEAPRACEVVPFNLDRLELNPTGHGPSFIFDQHRTGVRRQYYSTLPHQTAWRWKRRIGGETGSSLIVRAATKAAAIAAWKAPIHLT